MEAVATKSLRVLIVEDDPDTAESTAMLLRQQGHQVTTAYIATTALLAARRETPDAVLIDIGLPVVDGYRLLQSIQHVLIPKPVTIAITGHGQPSDRQRALQSGFDHFLIKPVDPQELYRILSDYADSLETRVGSTPDAAQALGVFS